MCITDLGRVPLSIVNIDGRQPDLVLLSAQRVEVIAEAQFRVLNLQDTILAVVLVGDAEELAVLLAGAKSEKRRNRCG